VVSIECSFLRIERLTFIHRPAQRKNPAIFKVEGEPQQERICNPREGGSIPDRRFSTGPFPVRYINIHADCKGGNFAIVSAGTLMSVAPLPIGFLLFQRQFVQSFMCAGIK